MIVVSKSIVYLQRTWFFGKASGDNCQPSCSYPERSGIRPGIPVKHASFRELTELRHCFPITASPWQNSETSGEEYGHPTCKPIQLVIETHHFWFPSRFRGRTWWSSLEEQMPILVWLPRYPKENLSADFAGAMTLGCILIGAPSRRVSDSEITPLEGWLASNACESEMK